MAKSRVNIIVPPVEVLFRRDKHHVSSERYSDKLCIWAESQMGVKLPQAYLDLLKKQNGGTLRLGYVSVGRGSGRGKNEKWLVCVESLPGISKQESDSLPELMAMVEEWQLPDGLVPLSGDGHTWTCFNYRECGPEGEPSLVYFDTEHYDGLVWQGKGREKQYFGTLLAKSFEEFLQRCFFSTGGEILIAVDIPRISLKKLDERLASIGCQGQIRKDSGSWDWKEFAGEYSGSSASLDFRRNGDKKDPWTLDRPGNHPLWLLNVSNKDQQAACKKLVAEFGTEISFLHVPPNRPRLKGIKVESSDSLDINKSLK